MATLEEKAIQKREIILKTTLELIFQHGFHGTPMSLIAEKADIGFGTIYRYFKNKEDLISELYRQIKKKLLNALFKDFSQKENFQKSYLKIVYNMIHYFIDNPKEFKFIEQFAYSPFINKDVRDEIEQELHQSLYALCAKGQEKGELKKIPFELTLSLTYGTVSSLINLHMDGRYILDNEKIELCVKSCWEAVKK